MADPRAEQRPAAIRAPGSSTEVWWLSPVTVTMLVVPTAVFSTAWLSDESFRLLWRSPKSITWEICLLLLSGGMALALGAATVSASRPFRPRTGGWPNLSSAETDILRRASTVLFALTLMGYAAFVVSGLRAGITAADLSATVSSTGVYDGTIKKKLGTIPGVTTLTEVGVASVIVSSLLLVSTPARREIGQLVVVLGLALPRAFFLTERLAILQLIVPLIVVVAARLATTSRSRQAMAVAPLLLILFVTAIFSLFEYQRSWVFYRSQSNASFIEFAVERLVGYYATALNNGALQIMYERFPGRWPYETWSALWAAPGIRQMNLYQLLNDGAEHSERYRDILHLHGNQEFSNSSGLAAPFVDLGVAGGLLFLFMVGVVLGLFYRGFRESRAFGLLLYPAVFIGLVELPRYLAWSQGRALPVFLALSVVAVLLRRATIPGLGRQP